MTIGLISLPILENNAPPRGDCLRDPHLVSIVKQTIEEQQSLSAVELFDRWHTLGDEPNTNLRVDRASYRTLLPATFPPRD